MLAGYNIIGLIETKTDNGDNVNIVGFKTFPKQRQKIPNTRSGEIMNDIKDDIVKYVNIINTDCKYVFGLK